MQQQHPRPRYCCGRIWLLSIAMLATAAAQAGPKERFRFEHLFRIDRVKDAQIAPDGSQVAVVTERRKSDAYFSTQQTLWLIPRESGYRKSAVLGKSVYVRVDLGGGGLIKKKIN